MSTTSPVPIVIPTEGDDPEVNHIVCTCNEDIAFCGADVSDSPWEWPKSIWEVCPLCALVIEEKGCCPRCGAY